MRILPIICCFSFLDDMIRITPTSAITGEKDVGLSSCTNRLLLVRPVKLNIQAVIVVPILAPIMTPTALCSFMMPELTRLTTTTVVLEDD